MGTMSTLLAVATTVAELLYKLSPIPDICKVHRRKNTGEMAELPIITLVVNCNLWTWYGVANDNYFPMVATQLIAQLAGMVFNAVYYRWSPTDKRKHLLKLYARALVVYCIVDLYCILGLVGALGMSKDDVATSLGYAGVAFSTAMSMSPLATLKRVVEMKSSASIPINMSVMMAVSTALWVVTGFEDNDWFVVGANAVGVVLGSVQVVLYYMYKPSIHGGLSALSEADKNLSVVVVTPTGKICGSVSPTPYKAMSSPVASVAP